MSVTARPPSGGARRGTGWLVATGVIAAFLIAWQNHSCPILAGGSCLETQKFLTSSPTLVVGRLFDPTFAMDEFLKEAWQTLLNASAALLITIFIGLAWFWLACKYDWIKISGYTLVSLLQVIPFVAFAWILHQALGPMDKVAFGVVVSVFPVIGALLHAIRNVEREDRELVMIYRASHLRQMNCLYYPKAASGFFSAIALAAPLSVVGVMIADLTGGDNAGLGMGVMRFARASDATNLWLYTAAAIVVSATLWMAVAAVELTFSKSHPWYVKENPYVGL